MLTDTATVTWDLSVAGQAKANATAGGSASPGPPQGRLTLQTATPVMITTQSAKTTIFYTPYRGNQCPIYNGTSFTMTAFAELSNLTTASSTGNAGPAAVAANSNYDLFVWNNSGTMTLTRGPAWTSLTARSAGTALVMVGGILLNNASITNGPAASRGTYVGTVAQQRIVATELDLWRVAAIGTAGLFGVWNCYNRVRVGSRSGESTDSWTYATAARFAPLNAATTRAHIRCRRIGGRCIYGELRLPSWVNDRCRCSHAGDLYDVTNAFTGSASADARPLTSCMLPRFGHHGAGISFLSAGETIEYGGAPITLSRATTAFRLRSESGLNFSGWM